MQSETLRIDVVILTWNDGAILADAVDSALASVGVDVRVVVVDNGSDPPAWMPENPRVVLVRSPTNRGVAAGRNLGVSCGDAPLVCLLDSDAQLERDALLILASAVADDGTVAMAVPVFVGQSPEAGAGRAPSLRIKVERMLGRRSDYESSAPPSARQWDVDFGIGACQVFRRSVFDAVGGIDERYFYGPEDVDFCLRVREAGWRIVQVRSAGCVHPPRRRYRRAVDLRTVKHGWAVARHLWRHRRFKSEVRP